MLDHGARIAAESWDAGDNGSVMIRTHCRPFWVWTTTTRAAGPSATSAPGGRPGEDRDPLASERRLALHVDHESRAARTPARRRRRRGASPAASQRREITKHALHAARPRRARAFRPRRPAVHAHRRMALEGALAERVERREVAHRRRHVLGHDERIAHLGGQRFDPGRDVRDVADRGVFVPLGRADPADHRLAVREREPDAESAAATPTRVRGSRPRAPRTLSRAARKPSRHGSGVDCGAPKMHMMPSPRKLSTVPRWRCTTATMRVK